MNRKIIRFNALEFTYFFINNNNYTNRAKTRSTSYQSFLGLEVEDVKLNLLKQKIQISSISVWGKWEKDSLPTNPLPLKTSPNFIAKHRIYPQAYGQLQNWRVAVGTRRKKKQQTHPTMNRPLPIPLFPLTFQVSCFSGTSNIWSPPFVILLLLLSQFSHCLFNTQTSLSPRPPFFVYHKKSS